MPRKQHVVTLTAAERTELTHLIHRGVAPARQLTRARILLLADTGHAGARLTDAQIAAALLTSPRTVARARAAFATGDLTQAVARKPPARVYARRLDGAGEAQLIALACSPPPPGRARWTLQLLADQLVALATVPAIAPNTVRATLKKTRSSRG
jgi:hypothetical protein